MDLVALLPWWAGVGLGVLLYVWLHSIASQPPTLTAVAPGQLSGALAQSVVHMLAGVGQYLAPLICLCGAAMSAWRRHQRTALLGQAAASPAATSALDGMSWQQFELLVGEAFRRQGYAVHENGGGGADGGVDLVLSRGGEKFLVQCKQWRAYKVGVDVVRELYGVMAARGAAGGFVVSSGRFTKEAIQFASGRNLRLIDGPQLHALIQQTRAPLPPAPAPVATPQAAAHEPACPNCMQPMARRVARQGVNAGKAFWGCTGYPACRGTRAIDN